jgi:hypothetical protein
MAGRFYRVAVAALALSGTVFVLSLSALVATTSGRWQNPLATALGLALDLVYMDPIAALTRLASFWLVPVLARRCREDSVPTHRGR